MSTVTDIKKAALSLFAHKGYEGTALSEIACGVGIKKPSLYAHFGSKDDLFLTVFKEGLKDYIVFIQGAPIAVSMTAEEKLRRILSRHGLYYKQHTENAALIKRAALFPPGELAEALRSEWRLAEKVMDRDLVAVFEEGMANGEIRALPMADLLFGYHCLIDGFFIQIFYHKDQDFEAKMESAWKIFWSGISARGKANGVHHC